MTMDISVIGSNYVQYVFGSETLAALGFLYLVVMAGAKYGWTIEMFIVILTPVFVTFTGLAVTPMIKMSYLFILGIILGFGMLAMIRR